MMNYIIGDIAFFIVLCLIVVSMYFAYKYIQRARLYSSKDITIIIYAMFWIVIFICFFTLYASIYDLFKHDIGLNDIINQIYEK